MQGWAHDCRSSRILLAHNPSCRTFVALPYPACVFRANRLIKELSVSLSSAVPHLAQAERGRSAQPARVEPCALTHPANKAQNTANNPTTPNGVAPCCAPAPSRVHNTIGVEVERAHLLRDIIQNLEADDTFYETRTMQFRVRENDALHKAFKAASEGA